MNPNNTAWFFLSSFFVYCSKVTKFCWLALKIKIAYHNAKNVNMQKYQIVRPPSHLCAVQIFTTLTCHCYKTSNSARHQQRHLSFKDFFYQAWPRLHTFSFVFIPFLCEDRFLKTRSILWIISALLASVKRMNNSVVYVAMQPTPRQANCGIPFRKKN